MNSLYVIVSIPLLLVLVGFNHAHGLTTFGKSGGNNQQNPPPQYAAQPRSCTSQDNCTLIGGTTCIKNVCLCGDNSHPINGACSNVLKGPRHVCKKKEDCVKNADCVSAKDLNKTIPFVSGIDKVCNCEEDFIEIGPSCAGSTSTFVSVLLLITTFCRILN